MPSTMTQTCALCGLRYANGAILELHIREDHIQQTQHAAPVRDDAAGSRPSPAQASASRSSAQASRLPHSAQTVTAGTAATRPRRRLAGPVMAALRRSARAARLAAQAVRYVNEELLRASEAISLRRAAEPRRPLQTPTDSDARPASGSTEPTQRAA